MVREVEGECGGVNTQPQKMQVVFGEGTSKEITIYMQFAHFPDGKLRPWFVLFCCLLLLFAFCFLLLLFSSVFLLLLFLLLLFSFVFLLLLLLFSLAIEGVKDHCTASLDLGLCVNFNDLAFLVYGVLGGVFLAGYPRHIHKCKLFLNAAQC